MSSSIIRRLALFAGSSCLATPLFAQVCNWNNSSGGNWMTAANWSGNNIADVATEEARFPTLALPYTVTLNSTLTIGTMTLNAGTESSVVIPSTRTLTISGGSLFNSGTIYVGESNAPSNATLRLTAPDTIVNGSGTIILGGYPLASRARLNANDTVDSGFVLFPNQRIQGAGQIFASNMFNQGIVRAETLGRLEIINTSATNTNPLVNTGTLRAIDGATLVMIGSLDNNSVGVITTDDTGIFRLETNTSQGVVISGLIDTSAGGVAQYATATQLLEDVELRGSHIAEGNFTLDDGVINNGSFRFVSTLSTTPTLRILESGAGFSTINGTGTISFEHNSSVYVVEFESATSTSILRFPNQDIQGSVRFRCNTRFGAQVTPGLAPPNRIGRLLFDRDCRLNSTSVTILDVQGATPNLRDEFAASGNDSALIIDPGATLRVRFGNNYVPSDGDIMTLINLQSSPVTGTFTNFELLNAPPGVTGELIYNSVGVRVIWSVSEQCDSIDFNNDSSFFDPQDIEAFLSVYSEGPCIPANATCNDIDFNNDTSLFDPCDINSFLVLYSEGPCTLCGV